MHPWRHICRQIGAEFIEGVSTEPAWEGISNYCKLRTQVQKWMIILEYWQRPVYRSDDQPFTLLRANYVSKDGFQFWISRKPLSWKLFGYRYGPYVELSRNVIIRGNDELKLRAFLANPKLYQMLQSMGWGEKEVDMDSFGLRAWPDRTDVASALYLLRRYLVLDVEQFKFLIDLLAETLNQLCYIGSASEELPTVEDFVPGYRYLSP